MPLNENTIYIAIELSTSIWLVGTRLPGATKSRMHRIAAGDTPALLPLSVLCKSDLSKTPAALPILLAASRPGGTASGCTGC